ncbi:radical SAM protein [Fundidesulfovibrio soli]|uniref:radical SAM protein n=1 Tax=Fundidesulfovibrio soli TaxID=2922716 RepID=UPI001FAF9473|nr:radical SAM protein [Fundidesulfovibrio soli]
MIAIRDMMIIQIDITNACVNSCSNCTRLIGHHRKPFFMEFDMFTRAVDSLADFPGMVGMIGGEPLLHPEFPRMARYLQERIEDPKRRGLWSTVPEGTRHGALIREVFGNLYLNDHTVDKIMHQPVLVAASEAVPDPARMWSLIDECWVQKCWSASITPKGAFFCEVAAAFDMLFDGPGGWPVEPGWWLREPHQFGDQKERWCPRCGCAVPLPRRASTEQVDDVSRGNLAELERMASPKVRKGRVALYRGEQAEDWNPHHNWYMSEVEGEAQYRERIAKRLDATE